MIKVPLIRQLWAILRNTLFSLFFCFFNPSCLEAVGHLSNEVLWTHSCKLLPSWKASTRVKSFVFPWCCLEVQGHLKALAVWLCHHKARLPSDHSRWWLLRDEGSRRSCLMYFRGYIFNIGIKPPILTVTCWACICRESTCSETWSEMYYSERLFLCLIHVDLVWTVTCSESYTLIWHPCFVFGLFVFFNLPVW